MSFRRTACLHPRAKRGCDELVDNMSDEGNPVDPDEKRGSSKTQKNQLDRRCGSHVFSASAASVITKILSLLLLKILALVLTKSDYGLYGFWFSLMFVLATFSTSSFSATLWRFLQSSRYDTIGKNQGL